jgi:hypothetical protein
MLHGDGCLNFGAWTCLAPSQAKRVSAQALAGIFAQLPCACDLNLHLRDGRVISLQWLPGQTVKTPSSAEELQGPTIPLRGFATSPRAAAPRRARLSSAAANPTFTTCGWKARITVIGSLWEMRHWHGSWIVSRAIAVPHVPATAPERQDPGVISSKG